MHSLGAQSGGGKILYTVGFRDVRFLVLPPVWLLVFSAPAFVPVIFFFFFCETQYVRVKTVAIHWLHKITISTTLRLRPLRRSLFAACNVGNLRHLKWP